MANTVKRNPNKYTLKNTEQYSSRLDVTMEIHDVTGDSGDTAVVLTTDLNVVLFAQVLQMTGTPLLLKVECSLVVVNTGGVKTVNMIIDDLPDENTARVVLFGLSY